MLKLLLSLLRPLPVIARELTALRELYESELASRQPPVYRLTEKPSKNDTEVSYAGIERRESLLERWQLDVGEEDD